MTGKLERTLTFVKPEAVLDGNIGNILIMLEEAGFRVCGAKMTTMSKETAGRFYKEHAKRDFFDPLTDYASSSPIMIFCVEKENGVEDLRSMIGATNPEDAREGTVRKLYGKGMRRNGIHASDSLESAKREISFFFSEDELSG